MQIENVSGYNLQFVALFLHLKGLLRKEEKTWRTNQPTDLSINIFDLRNQVISLTESYGDGEVQLRFINNNYGSLSHSNI